MNIYRVPFDFTHEEKVFGGYLSLRQMIYIIFSIISSGILFMPMQEVVNVSIFLILSIMFMIFAFLKIGSSYADKYFLNIVKYIFRKKIFTLER